MQELQSIILAVTVMPVTTRETVQAQPERKPLRWLNWHLVQLFTLFIPPSHTLYPVKVQVRTAVLTEVRT